MMFIMSKAIEWEKIDMRLLIDKLSRDQLRQTISDSIRKFYEEYSFACCNISKLALNIIFRSPCLMSVSLTNTPPSPTHNAPLSKYSLTSFGLIPPVGIRGTPGNIENNVFI